MRNSSLWLSSTYDKDLPLFRKLGLEVFRDLPNGTYNLGTVKGKGGGEAEVLVKLWPAMFFGFHITSSEGEKFVVNTGSGSLTDFWPSVELVMDSMFVPKPVD